MYTNSTNFIIQKGILVSSWYLLDFVRRYKVLKDPTMKGLV